MLTIVCQVSGSDDHSIKVWNVEQARCTNTFIGTYLSPPPPHSQQCDAVALIARCPSGEGHTRAVRTLQFADDGTLVSGSYDKTVKGTPLVSS